MLYAFDEKENAVLMQNELRFYGTVGLGRIISLPAAGTTTNDIIVKHTLTDLFWFLDRLLIGITILVRAEVRAILIHKDACFCYIIKTIISSVHDHDFESSELWNV